MMRLLFIIICITCISLHAYSQAIPNKETIFTIQKKDKQLFDFHLQKGYTLKAIVKQMGIDLSISVYKKGDTTQLAYFDSPNGEYGPEKIQFESKADGNYILLVEPLADDTAREGKFSIQQIYIKIFKAISDSSFADGSHILLDHMTSLQIENLTNLGMTWGFLKYYHPAIAAGDYNWDASLFRILPKIIVAKSKTDVNAALEKWVDEVGRPDRCTTCNKASSDTSIQSMPDYGDLFMKDNLGSSLIEKLNYIKENRNQEDNYYISMADGIGNPNFEHENSYKNMVYPDAGYRLLALFRYWNIIQYFYPYKYGIGEDWNKVLPEFIPKFVGAENATQYALVCLEIIARIHDTHANIWGYNKELTDYFGKYAAPVRARFIEDKLVVMGYYSDSFSLREKLQTGDVITKINGESLGKLINKNLGFTPASNYETQLRNMPYYSLLRSQCDSLKLELTRGDKKISCVVHCLEVNKINFYSELNIDSADSSYKILPGNIAYIFPGRYHDRQLNEIKKTFAIRRCVDRTHRTNCNRVWSVHAARPQLGTVASARLDRGPRGNQLLQLTALLQCTAEGGDSWFVPGIDCLLSLSAQREKLLSASRSCR